ncbi:response regulator transcription factor [Helicovermis profundi]|uniref:Stage 0 sporulation protein A homolog n=1 Tax=Helicovermis profundi TaxID=3065157 RepID=A0AAU9ENQ3_9FIRM|nr:response regulator transcription factor [Clostridia bacterium S502]
MEGNVLVLEDQIEIREFIVINIKRAGYNIFEAKNGEEALKIVNANKIDIAVLDVMLPGISGYDVCREIRKHNKYMGIIMLTAKSQEKDKIEGLISGADDYIVKPFSPKELVARIDSLYRRVKLLEDDSTEKCESGAFIIDYKNRQIFKDDIELDLTQLEFAIVATLIKNEGRPLSREYILDHVWGENFFGSFKIVDVNIRRLRQKLEKDASNPEYIITVWGFGYKWRKGE